MTKHQRLVFVHSLLLGLHYPLVSCDTRSLSSSVDDETKTSLLATPKNLRSLDGNGFNSRMDTADYNDVLQEDSSSFIHVDDGLTFTRAITDLNDVSFQLNLESDHCKSQDAYGDNNCHYNWGEQVLGNYTVHSSHVIQHGDTMTGTFHIDYVVPYEFTCLLCGEPCQLQIPVLNVKFTIRMPSCPIGPDFSSVVRERLMNFSPTDGIKTHLQGSVKLEKQRRSDDEQPQLIAQFTVSAYVK